MTSLLSEVLLYSGSTTLATLCRSHPRIRLRIVMRQGPTAVRVISRALLGYLLVLVPSPEAWSTFVPSPDAARRSYERGDVVLKAMRMAQSRR